MKKMKDLQPRIQQLKEQYKDNKAQLNQEIMQLYKQYKVNPFGGCLPILIQIPVFFALYRALLASIELRHAPFISYIPFTDKVWLIDLSAKDPYYITPILMGLSMFIQQKMTPTGGDALQEKLMYFMPIFLTFLFLNFPSGLVVYWLANNILSIVQQYMVNKKMAKK
jgi:YidC/Oxa1 family membrane protein insertase